MNESKFAAELEARGFTRLAPPPSPELSEEEPLTYAHGAEGMPSMTVATDDTHQSWFVAAVVPLDDLGFRQLTLEKCIVDFDIVDTRITTH